MHMTDSDRKLAKRLGLLASVIALLGALAKLASADGAQREHTASLEQRVTTIEQVGSPADRERDARMLSLLESIDARTKRIEDREDAAEPADNQRPHR